MQQAKSAACILVMWLAQLQSKVPKKLSRTCGPRVLWSPLIMRNWNVWQTASVRKTHLLCCMHLGANTHRSVLSCMCMQNLWPKSYQQYRNLCPGGRLKTIQAWRSSLHSIGIWKGIAASGIAAPCHHTSFIVDCWVCLDCYCQLALLFPGFEGGVNDISAYKYAKRYAALCGH